LDTRTEVCSQLDLRLSAAEVAIAADSGASPVLAAVVAEFRRKLVKARPAVEGGAGTTHREAVVELEQAADSAKMAALADPGAAPDTLRAVVSAHDTICWFKATGELLAVPFIEGDPVVTVEGGR
jgi:hypothetical protein